MLPCRSASARSSPLVTAALAVVLVPASTAVSAITAAILTVDGQVSIPLYLDRAALGRFPSRLVSASYGTDKGTEVHVFRGPTLYSVLQAARPRFDPATKNDKLRFAVLGTGSDGYAATVVWAELDPDFANTKVLVALSQDGKPLDRPRLVVPGDGKGGRYVSDLVDLAVVRIGAGQ